MRQLLLLLMPLLLYIPTSRGHNITHILADHPEFSTFNHYLTATHLAGEINRRLTITVLAVDNQVMSGLLASNPGLSQLYTLKNLLSLHVLVDYYTSKKLHQLTGGSAFCSTLFQASGSAPGTAGFVNITDRRAGRVLFAAAESGDAPPAAFVKSVKEIPNNISVIHISSALSSAAAEAPTTAPSQVNLTALMSSKGCKTFASLLVATADAAETFQSDVDGGLTVFCPMDQAMQEFMPKFKNLSANDKLSLLLYHGVPVYYSVDALKSNNGVMNTLATDGTSNNYNFTVQNDGDQVTLKTKLSSARITGTLIDEDPLAVHTIDKVLEPAELFKPAEAPTPAPEPSAPAADAPKAAGNAAGKTASPPAPANSPDEKPADQKAADESAGRRKSVGSLVVGAAAATATLLVFA